MLQVAHPRLAARHRPGTERSSLCMPPSSLTAPIMRLLCTGQAKIVRYVDFFYITWFCSNWKWQTGAKIVTYVCHILGDVTYVSHTKMWHTFVTCQCDTRSETHQKCDGHQSHLPKCDVHMSHLKCDTRLSLSLYCCTESMTCSQWMKLYMYVRWSATLDLFRRLRTIYLE